MRLAKRQRLNFVRHPYASRYLQLERGQSIVEFAFLIIPLILVSLFVVELGRAWTIKQTITNAAREGARILILPYGEGTEFTNFAAVEAAARNTVTYHLNQAGIATDDETTQITFIQLVLSETDGSITTGALAGLPVKGDQVGVNIQFNYKSLVQGFVTDGAATILMAGQSVMQHE